MSAPKAKDFSISTHSDGRNYYIKMSGRVDENVRFNEIEIPADKKIIFDLSDLAVFNSLGIASWLKWVKTLDPSISVDLVACSEFIVHKLNFFSEFVPTNTTVNSLYISYYCYSCEAEPRYLLERGTHYKEQTEKEKYWYRVNANVTCPECGEIAEFEYDMENYFNFLERGFGPEAKED